MQSMKVNRPLHLQLLSFNIKDFSSRYEVPIHYILGEADNITPTPLAKEYYKTIEAPLKTLAVIPGAGHDTVRERPLEFAAALRAVRETL